MTGSSTGAAALLSAATVPAPLARAARRSATAFARAAGSRLKDSLSRGAERRRLAQQQLCRVGAVFLPVSETSVEDVSPEACAIAIDVLFALRSERCGLLKRGVGARGVPHLHVVAAEVVPDGGVLLLLVDRDGAGQDVPRFRKHPIACQRFGGCRLQIDDRAVDAEMPGLNVAGRLRGDPLTRSLGSKGTKRREAQRGASSQKAM